MKTQNKINVVITGVSEEEAHHWHEWYNTYGHQQYYNFMSGNTYGHQQYYNFMSGNTNTSDDEGDLHTDFSWG
jgi:hypothetical protein